MKAVILAGGYGTRLKDVVKDVPKPMASVMGKPFLEHQLNFLKKQGIDDVVLAVHYMGDTIKSYFGSGLRWGINLTYSDEEIALGTAGAVKNAKRYIDDTFFVLNGDSYSETNLKEFLGFHRKKESEFTIDLSYSENASHYGNVIVEDGKITNFSEKSSNKKGFVSRGIYIFEPSIFGEIGQKNPISLERDVFPRLAGEGRLCGYFHEGHFMDIGRPETYDVFKRNFLERLVMSPENNVREAIKKMRENEVDLVLVTDKRKSLRGVLTNRIIGRYLEEGNLDDKLENAALRNPVTVNIGEERKISELLLSGINHLPILDKEKRVCEVRFRTEEIKKRYFPVVRGKSPLRISFAGGGTDVPYFFEKYGGVVINSTIDKYCHATAVRRADNKIIINSEDGESVFSCGELEYNGEHDIIKAVTNMVNPDFGFELYLHNDVPPGRGLGSSASLSVLITKLLGELQGRKFASDELAKIAYRAESEELKIKGGWQDQYAAVNGGFNFMEFNKDKTIIYPLRLKEETVNELNSRLLLYYVGVSHFSGDIHEEQEKTFLENEEESKRRLDSLKRIAIETKDSLLTGRLDDVGRLLHESWEIKREVNSGISDHRIDELYETGIENGAIGGKLLGAGGGGYLLFFHSPKKRSRLVKALKEAEGEIMDFNFDFNGIQTWDADNY